MPYTIKFDTPTMGYAGKGVRKGEELPVVYRQFLSSEDGMFFITILENLVSPVVNKLPQKSNIKPSQIDHLLAHMDKDGVMTVYVNELPIVAEIRTHRPIKKGEEVYESDIIDIKRLKFEGVEIPKGNAILVVFSKGWRKGLYFDFSPMHKNASPPEGDLWNILGNYYNYLNYQEFYSLNDEQWVFLHREKWFPFISLTYETSKALINTIQANHSPDILLERIEKELNDLLPDMVERWENSSIFGGELEFLKTAIDRFLNKDYVSATSILYPRIEGILRKLSQKSNLGYKQDQLSSAPLKMVNIPLNRYSKLLPDKFSEYLKTVYFANFNPESPEGLSRNTVSHGVASITDFSLKGAVLGLLIIEQIYFLIPTEYHKQVGVNHG